MRSGATCRAGAALAVALTILPVMATADAPAGDTTYDDGPTLGERLLRNVVRVQALDLPEHGFGIVVGVDAGHVYVATARHVVGRRPIAGLEGAERISQQIRIGFCALPLATPMQSADLVEPFDGASDDLALLRTALPSGYVPERRALALPERGAPGDQAWQLGRENDCMLVPTPGLVAALPNERHELRVDLHNVLGGASGGPVVSGYGIVGLIKRSDSERVTAHAIADVLARMHGSGLAVPLALEPARNMPPGDPQAAVSALTQALTAYLFGARDLQKLLEQDVVSRTTFADFVKRYSHGVERYEAVSKKYDGTLMQSWSADVFTSWQALRERLWKIHLIFYDLNGDTAKKIAQTEHSPHVVQDQMTKLEPELVALEAGMARFADDLATKGVAHAKSPP